MTDEQRTSHLEPFSSARQGNIHKQPQNGSTGRTDSHKRKENDMQNKEKGFVEGVLFTIAGILLIIVITVTLSTVVQAKTPRNGKRMDALGNIYIYKHGKLKTGWFTYHGKRYYGHKTKSACYPVGSVTQQGFRLKNGKMYYFGRGGAKLTHNDRYIGLNRHSTSVHYIYAPGMGGRRYRYNANRRRYQYLTNSGRWIDTGNQCYPYGMMDFQE